MRSGKDVYLEKPVGHTVEERAVLIAEAERSGRLLEVGLQQRSGTLFADAGGRTLLYKSETTFST
jgi:predicted dehydrogenase